jgi:hypothetical protein
MDAECVQDVPDVVPNRLLTQRELGCDLLGRVPVLEQPKHLRARPERVKRGGRRAEPRGSEKGAGGRVRTDDIQLGRLALYQLSYARARLA